MKNINETYLVFNTSIYKSTNMVNFKKSMQAFVKFDFK